MTTFRIEVTSEPDGLGRQSFVLFWKDYPREDKFDQRPANQRRQRAQHLFARVEDHIKRLRSQGHRVIES